MDRSLIVAEARAYIDTPYLHQGRSKTAGVDCVGVIIGVAHELGISDFDITDYGRTPDPDMMRKLLRENLDQIGFKQLLPGDIVWFRVENDPQHIGIITALDPISMVHSFSKKPLMRVVETPLGDFWKSRIIGCFRYRGID